MLIFIVLILPEGLISSRIALSFPVEEEWKIWLLQPAQGYKNHEPRVMELNSIILHISTINEKLV